MNEKRAGGENQKVDASSTISQVSKNEQRLKAIRVTMKQSVSRVFFLLFQKSSMNRRKLVKKR